MTKTLLIFTLLIFSVTIVASYKSAKSLFVSKASVLGMSINIADFVNEPFDLEIISGKPVQALDFVPGEVSDYGEVKLVNQSALPVNFYMYTTEMDGSICPSSNIQIEISEDGSSNWETIYEGLTEDLRGNNDRLALTVDQDYSLNELYVRQQIQLAVDADKNDEGEECLWTEVFRAENKSENYKKELFIARNKLTSYFWTPPYIEVKEPSKDGAEFGVGKKESIKWKLKTVSVDEDLVKTKVELYDATGATSLEVLAEDLYGEDTLKWVVPDELLGGEYLIRIYVEDPHGLYAEDFSDYTFTVVE